MKTVSAALITLCAVLTPAASAGEALPALSLDQRMLLRCSAAFALAAKAQQAGDPAAMRYPPLAARGREFFVRSAAQVMDAGGLDRARISALLAAEARTLATKDALHAIMPVCLNVLDDSGL